MSKVLIATLVLCVALAATPAVAMHRHHHRAAHHALTPGAAAASVSIPADAVTSAPVPDTRANRALYRPLSRTGRMSAANGN